jgi:hypothetical protein
MDPVSESFSQYMADYTGGHSSHSHVLEFEIYDPLTEYEDVDDSTVVVGGDADRWEQVVDNDRKLDDLGEQVAEDVTSEEYYKSLVVDDDQQTPVKEKTEKKTEVWKKRGGAVDFRQNIFELLDRLPLK